VVVVLLTAHGDSRLQTYCLATVSRSRCCCQTLLDGRIQYHGILCLVSCVVSSSRIGPFNHHRHDHSHLSNLGDRCICQPMRE
jgi:hypothetical protein